MSNLENIEVLKCFCKHVQPIDHTQHVQHATNVANSTYSCMYGAYYIQDISGKTFLKMYTTFVHKNFPYPSVYRVSLREIQVRKGEVGCCHMYIRAHIIQTPGDFTLIVIIILNRLFSQSDKLPYMWFVL